jgi:hypothetical protein
MTLSLWILSCLFFLIAPEPPTGSVALEYNVIARGDTVGILTVVKTTGPDQTEYHSVNETKVRFIKTFHLQDELTATFKEGKLINSEVTALLNGNTHKHTRISYRDSTYKVFSEGEAIDSFPDPVYASIIQIYFEEPTQIDAVFSERFAEWYSIEQVSNNPPVYELDKKGKPNLYHYHNGRMVYAELGTRLISTELRLRE